MLEDNRNKITLIVPAAGKSSRYPGMRPKWMLTHPEGDMMIEKVLKSFEYEKYKSTYITILREHCLEFEADIVLSQAFGSTVNLVILDKSTESCPETIYSTIKSEEIEGRIIIKDTDCLVETSSIPDEDFVVGMTIDENSQVDRIQNKSFIVKNDDNIIFDLVEKSIVSNTVCLGVYCLSSSAFIDAYDEIMNSNLMFRKKELYVSHVISHLILNKKHLFNFVPAGRYLDWGTLREWQKEREKYNTYIFDIDGVMLVNYGKYGSRNWENTFEPIEENIAIVKELSDLGNEIIFMTSRPDEYLSRFKDYMNEVGIIYKTIVSNCNHCKRTIINDFAATNPYPSCESISVKRNSSLRNII